MKVFILVCLLAIFQTAISQESPNPAVKVQLSLKGLNYAATYTADWIAKEVAEIKIKDISGNNYVKYSVTNIKIDSFRKPFPDISMIPGHSMKLSFKNAALSSSGNWKYKKWFISDHGTVKASVSDLSISLSININVDSEGKPKLYAHSCSVYLRNFKIKMSGGASFFYNLILGLFDGKVKSSLQNSLCKAAIKSINIDSNRKLATLNLKSNIGNGLILDYSLKGPPMFTRNYLISSHKGTFIEDTEKPKFPLIETFSHSMMGFSIAAEAFNSAARVLFQNNILHKEYDIREIKNRLVQLDQKFSDAGLSAKLNITSAPTMTITQNFIFLILKGQTKLIAYMPCGSTLSVMTIDISIKAPLEVKMKNERLYLNVTKITYETKVKVTILGKIIPTSFSNALAKEITEIGRIAINKELDRGVRLPNFNKIKFIRPSVKLHEGYLNVDTNMVYSP